MVDLLRYRATSGKRNFIERIKAPIFLEAVLAKEMLEPQSNLEEKLDPSIFTSITPMLLDQPNETSWFCSALKFLRQSTVSHRSHSSSEANSTYCHRSDA